MGPVARMTRILNCLLDGPQRLTQISIVTGMGKGTIHKLLRTMETTGFIIRDPVFKDYHFGPMFWNISTNLSNMHEGLIACASDEMRKLRDESGASITLFIRSAGQRVALKELPSTREFRVVSLYTAPIYTGSSGIVLLSRMTDDQLSRLFDMLPSDSFNREDVLSNIKLAREQGYLVATGTTGTGQGMCGLSIPIDNYFIPVALTLSDFQTEIKGSITSYLPKILAAEKKISDKVAKLTQSSEYKHETLFASDIGNTGYTGKSVNSNS